MNGQNTQLPAWLGLGMRVTLVVVALIGFGFTGMSKVDAIDSRVNELEIDDEKDDKQLQLIRETQIKVVTILERLEDKMEELHEDVEDLQENH